jgi:hypothetical protein
VSGPDANNADGARPRLLHVLFHQHLRCLSIRSILPLHWSTRISTHRPCSWSQSDFHPYLQVPTRCPASKHSSKGSNCTIGFSEPHRCLHLHSVIQSGAVKQSLEAEMFLGFFVACHQICRLGVGLSCQAHALGRRREFGDASLVRIDEFLLLGQQGPRARSSRR